MLIKINKKPIKIDDEPGNDKKGWLYVIVSCIGYALILWIMDLVCFTFFYIHPFPFMQFMTKIFIWLGGM